MLEIQHTRAQISSLIKSSPGIVTVQPKRIVFIDDNPVILRWYARLFQKADSPLMAAATVQKSYDLVVQQPPHGLIKLW